MRTRRGWAVVGAAGLLVAVGGVALVSVTNAETTAATAKRLPPAGAPAEQVLRVYLRAATEHDCALTEALTDSSGSESRDMAWCGDRHQSTFDTHPDLLSYRNIGSVRKDDPAQTGGVTQECIPVDITQTNMSGADPGAMPGWQFCFRHTPSGWRLTDEGYG